MSRRMPLAHVLWTVLGETGYYDYAGEPLQAVPSTAGRILAGTCQSSYRNLIVLGATAFSAFRFIEKSKESKGDLGTARALGEHEDVVQVLSIHSNRKALSSRGFCC